MEEVLYKNLFMYVKQMLHHPKFKPILLAGDNDILNFLMMAMEESWRVWMDAKHGEDLKDE